MLKYLAHRMSVEARIEIERANAAFYRALESGLIERMDEVWAHEDRVTCVHPGWDILTGWHQVRESWEAIFGSGQKMRTSPSDVSVHPEGDFAWVTCTENITIFNDSSFDSVKAVATNLFIRREGQWLMVHHHASPIPMILSDDSPDMIQ